MLIDKQPSSDSPDIIITSFISSGLDREIASLKYDFLVSSESTTIRKELVIQAMNALCLSGYDFEFAIRHIHEQTGIEMDTIQSYFAHVPCFPPPSEN